MCLPSLSSIAYFHSKCFLSAKCKNARHLDNIIWRKNVWVFYFYFFFFFAIENCSTLCACLNVKFLCMSSACYSPVGHVSVSSTQ